MKPYSKRRGGNPRAPQHCDPGNRVHESASAKGKIRGTPRQLVERYLQFAEEARLANDRVASEAFLQSAEHYIRIGKPAPAIENAPAPATHPARASTATVERFSAEGIPTKASAPPTRMAPAPEPEPVIVSDEARRQEDEALRQASIAAKRAMAKNG